MKQLTTVTLLLFFFISSVRSQTQFKWVKGGGTTDDFTGLPYYQQEKTEYMCTDANGNIYAVSQVGSTPITADTFHASAHGANVNILITSYNCSGQMRWAKLIASNGGECIPYGIATDHLGHVYVAGYLTNQTLYIGYDTTIPGLAYEDQGLIQLDTSGHFKWVRYVGDNTISSLMGSYSFGSVLAIDSSNDTHFFLYTKHGVHITPAVTSIGGTYDLVFNSAGTLLSNIRLDLDSQWYLNSAIIDHPTNKLYVSGQNNQGIFGGFLTDTFYAAAFDASRDRLWQYFCGHGDDDGVIGIVMDQGKHLYFAGASQSGVFSFHGDSVTETAGAEMAIVMKTDTNGNVNWIKHFDDAATSINGFNAITLLPDYKVAAFGTFAGATTDGMVTLSTPPGEGYTPFFVVLDSGKNLVSIKQLHGNGFDNGGVAITSDKVGSIYLGGEVVDSIWADSPHIPAYHSVGGNSDFFVMKYGVDCSCTAAPIASYTDTGSHTVDVTFTGTTSGLDSVRWTFGDGGTATGTTALHTYTASGTYHVCVTVYTSCGSDSHCSDVVIHLPSETSIVIAGDNIHVYPNPANDELNITGIQSATRFRILNVTGDCITQGWFYLQSNVVSLKNIPAGVYMLEMSKENGERSIARVVKE